MLFAYKGRKGNENGERICKKLLQLPKMEEMQRSIYSKEKSDRRRVMRNMQRTARVYCTSQNRADAREYQ